MTIKLPEHRPQARSYFARGTNRDFKANAAEITLYDEIGFWGVTAADFRKTLGELKGEDIVLKLNSPGGDVFDGIAIYNDLLAHKGRVDIEVTGLAASAASIIAMAGDSLTMADNSFLMIHNAWSLAIGDKNDMTSTAEVLGKIDEQLAATYAKETERDLDEITAMMDAETWMNAKEAVELGFADEVGEEAAVNAAFDLSVFKNSPKDVGLESPAIPQTERDLERCLREAGFSRSEAKATASKAFANSNQRDAEGIEAIAASLRRNTIILTGDN